MEFLGSIVVEASKLIFISLYSRIAVIVKLQKNVEKLQTEASRLMILWKKVCEELAVAEKDGRVPTTLVKEWLNDVGNMEKEVNSIQEIEADMSCLLGSCPNCRQRYRLAKKVKKMIEEAEELIVNGEFPNGKFETPSPEGAEVRPSPPTAHPDTLGRILDLLGDYSIGIVGLWGMGGVGKTTLVKNLNNELKGSAHLFDIVIWVTVSRDLDLRRVQSEIAERLNLELRVRESTERRASRLFERLKKEKKILVILDDVWEKVDLDEVGIPIGEAHRGCKLVLTTRSLDVCREMKTQAEIKVEVLSEEEAWRLFGENAGRVVESEDFKPVAKLVSRECSGLPLAIVTVGKAMRGKTKIELWKNALRELQRPAPQIKGLEKEVFSPLKWSYDSLQGKNAKSCFLYCSLFPEDYSIKTSELIQCWVAEGLIDDDNSLEDSKNKGIAFIEYLKDSSMLENGAYEGTVKMHDVIRDVALWIGSSGEVGSNFVILSGLGLTDLMVRETWKVATGISLMNNKLARLPDQSIECPKLSTMFLQGNPLKERIPPRFLQGLEMLSVLNLSATHIRSLPQSISNLGNLKALFLGDCHSLEELPPLDGLKNLMILDLHFARIKELPPGMGKLRNLRNLNLSHTHCLVKIPSGMMASLSSLEELDMSFSAYTWGDAEGHTNERRASLKEFGSLRRLALLYIRIDNTDCLSPDSVSTWLKDLIKFRIYVGPTNHDGGSVPSSYDERRVVLEEVDLSCGGLEELFRHTESLVLKRCRGVNEISELSTTSMTGLKSLTLVGCDGITNLIRGEEEASVLSSLEELNLYHMKNLEGIWEGMVPRGASLINLKRIQVHECPRLKSLISYFLLQQLGNLEEISATFCYAMEEVIAVKVVHEFALPKLRCLVLAHLPKLRCVCQWVLEWSCLEQIHVHMCPNLHKLPLCLNNAQTICKIKGNRLWWSELRWVDVHTHQTFQPLFEAYESDEEEGIWASRSVGRWV